LAAHQVKYAITVVAPPGYPHSGAFIEVAKGLVAGLRALGLDTLVTTQGNLPGRKHIVLGANLLPLHPMPLASDAILYNLEQIEIGSSWVKPELIELYKKYTVWDYSPRNVAALKTLGVNVERVVPVGYEPELTRIAKAETHDIDVLFIGSMNERRKAILDAFTKAGVRTKAFFGVYGDARDALYARARLVLNVHFYEAKVLEIVRLSYLLANRIPVLSERGADPAEDAALAEGVAFADYDRLVQTGLELLATPGACTALGERGFAVISKRRQSEFLRTALAL
jgi:hypothetical protein